MVQPCFEGVLKRILLAPNRALSVCSVEENMAMLTDFSGYIKLVMHHFISMNGSWVWIGSIGCSIFLPNPTLYIQALWVVDLCLLCQIKLPMTAWVCTNAT